MANYREECPRFSGGAEYCCGAQHEIEREASDKEVLPLRYKDGREETIPKYSCSEPDLLLGGLDFWYTVRRESKEVAIRTIRGKLFDLINESRDALEDIHPGTIATELRPECPYLKKES